MAKPLESISLAEAEINEPALDDFIRALEQSSARLRGFVLVRRGKAAFRHFWKPYQENDPVWVYSLSKSFCSTAVGFAVQERLLETRDRVLSFFPEYEPLISDENCRAMTVQDLLTMRTGHEVDTLSLIKMDVENWAEAFLKLPVKFAPGTHFVYNSGATYMLSAIVQKLTGQKIHDYLKPRLFGPLGGPLEGGETSWDSSPQGINTGGWGLMVTLEDIAKLGLLYLRRGNWQGNQILSEKWVDEALHPHADNSITPGATADWIRGYGYQFWRSRYGWRGVKYGQPVGIRHHLPQIPKINPGPGERRPRIGIGKPERRLLRKHQLGYFRLNPPRIQTALLRLQPYNTRQGQRQK